MALINSTINPRIDLHNVDFEFKVPEENFTHDNEVHLQMQDEVDIKDFDDEHVYITFTRKVFHEPDCYFHISVTLGGEYEINRGSDIELTKSNLMKELQVNKKYAFIPGFSESLIVN